MQSPLSRIAPTAMATPTTAAPSPLAAIQAAVPASVVPQISAFRDEDVENLGSDVTWAAGATTEKIIRSIGVSKFEEIGATLVAVQSEADQLDPASIAKGGILGWVQKTVDIFLAAALKFDDDGTERPHTREGMGDLLFF